MDFGDIGSLLTAENTENAIARVRAEARTNKFPITGICYNKMCGDVSKDRPFCSIECRNEYDKLDKLANRK